MKIRVGIPSGLMNMEHGEIWDLFFREIGAEVIKSGPTNREILDMGIENCVAEACLPVKIFHGHVAKLKEKADYILIPRYTSISRRKYVCPKLGGLPDLVRNSIEHLPPVIDAEINFYKNPSQILKTAGKAASYVTSNRSLIKKACIEALKNYESSREKFISSIMASSQKNKRKQQLKIAVLGHYYMLHDNYINMNLTSKLERMGFEVITPEMRNTAELRKTGDILPKKMFWDFGARAVGFARKMAEEKVDGFLYVSSFGCGIDAFVSEIVSGEIKRAGIPFSLINIDEHTGEAGMDTRLEAFADMISRRSNQQNENNLSSFRQCIYNC